ncbi:MAG: hypothetical protein WBA82_05865 [Castellaniella sp.]|uniref:hypothetical protein n=1 Tax=Castellaniella sp. TaxID=1955812 RepID=UPI003C7449D7
MDLGDVFQTVALTACNRMLPGQTPMKSAVCGGLAVVGHVAGDLAQPVIARSLGGVLVSISQRGQDLAVAEGADEAAEEQPEGLQTVLKEIGSGWVGQELAKTPCDIAAATLPKPLSTAAGLACETVASYTAGKVLPGVVEAYLEHFHPPLQA